MSEFPKFEQWLNEKSQKDAYNDESFPGLSKDEKEKAKELTSNETSVKIGDWTIRSKEGGNNRIYTLDHKSGTEFGGDKNAAMDWLKQDHEKIIQFLAGIVQKQDDIKLNDTAMSGRDFIEEALEKKVNESTEVDTPIGVLDWNAGDLIIDGFIDESAEYGQPKEDWDKYVEGKNDAPAETFIEAIEDSEIPEDAIELVEDPKKYLKNYEVRGGEVKIVLGK